MITRMVDRAVTLSLTSLLSSISTLGLAANRLSSKEATVTLHKHMLMRRLKKIRSLRQGQHSYKVQLRRSKEKERRREVSEQMATKTMMTILRR